MLFKEKVAEWLHKNPTVAMVLAFFAAAAIIGLVLNVL
jgi:hypothetical protein